MNAIYEPESKVPKPVTPLWSIRGLTTQNWVSLRIRSLASELCSDFHAFLVVAQFDAGNVSDIDVQHFNNGVVDFDAFGTVHQQRNDRAAVADVFNQKPAAGNQRNQRNQPHDRREDIGFLDTRRGVIIG